MNTASRLESANKALGTKLLVAADVVPPQLSDGFTPMGRIRLRGRATPVEVLTALPGLSADQRAAAALAFARFEAGERQAGATLSELAAASGESALARLAERLAAVGPGGVYDAP
jgi:adenylate cyclase